MNVEPRLSAIFWYAESRADVSTAATVWPPVGPVSWRSSDIAVALPPIETAYTVAWAALAAAVASATLAVSFCEAPSERTISTFLPACTLARSCAAIWTEP